MRKITHGDWIHLMSQKHQNKIHHLLGMLNKMNGIPFDCNVALVYGNAFL